VGAVPVVPLDVDAGAGGDVHLDRLGIGNCHYSQYRIRFWRLASTCAARVFPIPQTRKRQRENPIAESAASVAGHDPFIFNELLGREFVCQFPYRLTGTWDGQNSGGPTAGKQAGSAVITGVT
jgi:hypothetical protein